MNVGDNKFPSGFHATITTATQGLTRTEESLMLVDGIAWTLFALVIVGIALFVYKDRDGALLKCCSKHVSPRTQSMNEKC